MAKHNRKLIIGKSVWQGHDQNSIRLIKICNWMIKLCRWSIGNFKHWFHSVLKKCCEWTYHSKTCSLHFLANLTLSAWLHLHVLTVFSPCINSRNGSNTVSYNTACSYREFSVSYRQFKTVHQARWLGLYQLETRDSHLRGGRLYWENASIRLCCRKTWRTFS